MGKPFINELKHIPTTIEQANLLDVSLMKKYLCDNIDAPFFIVGSGGAIAIAETLVLVIEQLSGAATAVTPYELAMKSNILPRFNVIFVSANGRNPDIINAYNCAKKSDVKSTYCICLKKSSKLIQNAREKYNERNCFEWDLPCGRDGFLAVNSSIAFLTLFSKILGYNTYINFDELLSDINSLSEITLSNMTYIALGGGWSLPIAIDFESKCTEAGLVNVQIADYRNFAHGRHHWLAKNPNSILIAFTTMNDHEIVSRTFNVVPNDYQKVIVRSCQTGICATLELMIKMFYIVHYIGTARKIDPGKPGVPDFGSELYHMHYRFDQTSWVKTISNKYYRAAFRKYGNSLILDNTSDIEKSAHEYWELIRERRYRGIVFDYDGTIIHDNNTNEITFLSCTEQIVRLLASGLYIGFATGRGRSIRQQLLDIIPVKYHEHVIIGYNNGAFIECLGHELNRGNKGPYPDMACIRNCISEHPILRGMEKKEDPYQISMFVKKSDLLRAKNFLQSKIDASDLNIRLVVSDHSIDIIPKGISKVSLVKRIKELCKGDVLCFGDSFQECGNDYDMQISDFALSVNNVPFSEDLSWNVSQPGIFGAAATLEYLKDLQIDELGLVYFK